MQALTMSCPLCGGPVHEEDGHFACEVGHLVDHEQVAKATELKLGEAMWMAIQALENEADVLRAIGGDAAAPYADDAERQARELRAFAHRHAGRGDTQN